MHRRELEERSEECKNKHEQAHARIFCLLHMEDESATWTANVHPWG